MKRKQKGKIALLVVSLVLSIAVALNALLAYFGPAGQLHEDDLVELTATVTDIRFPDPSVGEIGTICTLEYGDKVKLGQIFDLADVQTWASLQPGETIVFGIQKWAEETMDQIGILPAETVRTDSRSIVSLDARNAAKRQDTNKAVWYSLAFSVAVMALAVYSAISLIHTRKAGKLSEDSKIKREPLSVTYKMSPMYRVQFYRSVILSSAPFSILTVVAGMIFVNLFFMEKRFDVLIWGGGLLLICFFLVSKAAPQRAVRGHYSAMEEAGSEENGTRTVLFEEALCFLHDSQPFLRFEYSDITRCICGKNHLIVRTKAGRYGYIPIENGQSELKSRMMERLRAENPYIRFSNVRRGILTLSLVLLAFLFLGITEIFVPFGQ